MFRIKLASFILLISIATSAVFLPSCAVKAYSDEQTCASLANIAMQTVSNDKEFSFYSDEQIKYEFGSSELYDDCSILYSTDTEDISEIGIFHVKDFNDTETFYSTVEDYIISMREDKRAFIESYAPNELSKLDGARIYTLGNYIVYTVLSAKDREKVMESLETQLKK